MLNISYFRRDMNYKETPNRKVFNIDFDGTLTDGQYIDNPPPNIVMIERVTKLYTSGHVIIIWTARHWYQAPFLVSWLIKHSVPFHGVMMSKGGSDYYVDDKMISFENLFDKEF